MGRKAGGTVVSSPHDATSLAHIVPWRAGRVSVLGTGDPLPLAPSAWRNLPAGLSSGSRHSPGQGKGAHRHDLGHPMGFSVCHPRGQARWEGDKPTSLHPLLSCVGLGPGRGVEALPPRPEVPSPPRPRRQRQEAPACCLTCSLSDVQCALKKSWCFTAGTKNSVYFWGL